MQFSFKLFYDFYSFLSHRHGGGEHPDVHGYDDDVASDRVPALQADAVRTGGRLAYADRFTGGELLLSMAIIYLTEDG